MLRGGMDAAEWIPLRWPGEWPASALELLQGTVINCLVVSRQPELEAVLERARSLGMAVAALEGEAPEGVALIRYAERSKLDWSAPEPVLAVRDAVWPGIARGTGAGAGPTGLPWVDSNGWFIQLARARAPAKTWWVVVDPPAKDRLLSPASYELAVADAEAYGGRWVVSLDERVRAGLTAGEARAVETWRRLARALEFFKARRGWNEFRLVSVVALISDFSGPNEELSGELLNLAARRPLPVRPIEKSAAAAASFSGLKAVIYPDQSPPEEQLRRKLLAFVRAGGLLIANHQWTPLLGEAAEGDAYRRFQVRRLGRGRLAVAREAMLDAYAAVMDVHLLLSHRWDPVQFFNAGSVNSHYAASPDGRRAVVQLLNYAMRPAGHPVSVSFPVRYRAARLWTLEASEPAPLKLGRAGRGVEAYLPPLQAYAAVELEA